jgi:hypothetical protein
VKANFAQLNKRSTQYLLSAKYENNMFSQAILVRSQQEAGLFSSVLIQQHLRSVPWLTFSYDRFFVIVFGTNRL